MTTVDNMSSMRDIIIDDIYCRMKTESNLFFLSADFGSPQLDKLREDFPDNFFNIGIAEQNTINIALGLALEGNSVIIYGIAPFITMRAFEQLRVNLAIHSQLKNIDVTILGVGAGLSYDVSGPSHHCMEDISIINTLPFFSIYSPSDSFCALQLFKHSRKIKKPKYFRLDGKPLPVLSEKINAEDVKNGFRVLNRGNDICIISTGYMSQTSYQIIKKNNQLKITLIDILRISTLNAIALQKQIKKHKYIFSIEEGFIDCGGLDSIINKLCIQMQLNFFVRNFGFAKKYIFDMGTREELHKQNKLDCDSIADEILKTMNKINLEKEK